MARTTSRAANTTLRQLNQFTGGGTSRGKVAVRLTMKISQTTESASHLAHIPDDSVRHLEPLGIPVANFFREMRRRWWVLAATVLIGMIPTVFLILNLKSRYIAEASILVEPRRTSVSDLQVISAESQESPNLIQTQIDIMRSPALARKVAEELNLGSFPEFSPGNPGIVRRALNRIKAVFTAEQADNAFTDTDRTILISQNLASKLTFNSTLRSSVINVSVETEDAKLSALIANELARQYLELSRSQKYATLERAIEWFKTRLMEVAEQVSKSQAALQHYREQNGLNDFPIDASGQNREGLSGRAQQLAEVNRQLLQVAGERARQEAEANQIMETLRSQGRPDGRRELPLQLSNSLIALRAQESTWRDMATRLSAEVAAQNSAAVGMAGLIAEARASRIMYDSFLARAAQLANSQGIQQPDAELVSPAMPPPSPASPMRARLAALAFGFFVILGVALTLLLNRMRTGFSSPQEVETKLGLNHLASIPNIKRFANPFNTRGRIAHDFRSSLHRIRTELALRSDAANTKILAIASALPKEGKTSLAIGLADDFARSGKRTLLLGCDMLQSNVANASDINAQYGLADVLVGRATLAEVVIQMPSGLFVVPAYGARSDLVNHIEVTAIRTILAIARTDYDLTLLDTPPILPAIEALILTQAADATVLVVREGKTPIEAAQTGLAKLRQARVRVLGVVVTNAKFKNYGHFDGQTRKLFRRYRDQFA